MDFQTLNEQITFLFMEELARQGVTDVFVAPGSRSTPLVLACAKNQKMTVHTHFDERGLGFFALGYAKQHQKPVLIITTSGTAVANLLPAVVEAYYSLTPLLICTADRPPELINVGANQAITQKDIFRNFTCENFEISPVSEKTIIENILTVAGHSVFKTVSEKSPVHINWMFQEPLVPSPVTSKAESVSNFSDGIKKWLLSDYPYTSFEFSKTLSSQIEIPTLAKSQKILVIFGSLLNDSENELLKIADKINAPVFCDVQNSLRFKEFPQNISRFDLLLDITTWDTPDVILHLGGPLTSKKLNQYIENFKGEYIQVQNFSKRLDFMHKQKRLISASVKDFAVSILNESFATTRSYLENLKHNADLLEKDLESEFKGNLTEMSLPYHLVSYVKNANFFIGSSMPIRDLERFGGFGEDQKFIFNRGASGIDGNIATAMGMALESSQRTICVLGDQAFLYDVNSLALVRNCQKTFHTVVINNQGGGIFSFLPVSQVDKTIFQMNFTNPHEWNLKSAAEMFHLKYLFVKTPEDLLSALDSDESTLIEVKTDIHDNVLAHRELTIKLKKKYE